MGSTDNTSQVSKEVFPYIRVYNDGTVERLAGTEKAPAGLDPPTQTISKDILIVPETGVSARLYRPNSTKPHQKLPLLLYFHGGAFCISSTADPKYHTSLNHLVAEANVLLLSVDYRLAPEHPLPTAFHDSWDAVQWVASHIRTTTSSINSTNHSADDSVVQTYTEPWFLESADFDQIFLIGDSAGSSLAHYLCFRIQESNLNLNLHGIIMINPYFWGKYAIGVEITDEVRKRMVDNWWTFVCTSDKGCDDPLINPFADGAPSVDGLGCERLLVVVAEKDILRDRGRLYYKRLVNSGWRGKAEIVEIEGEDHVFHIFDPESHKAKGLIKRLACFINQSGGGGGDVNV